MASRRGPGPRGRDPAHGRRDAARSPHARRRLAIVTAVLGAAVVAAAAVASAAAGRASAAGPASPASPASGGSQRDAGAGLMAVGSPAPDFELLSETGTPVRLSAYRGRTVVLEFFATWCPHCQEAAPLMVALSNRLPASDYAVVAVSNEDAASVVDFRDRYRITYQTVLDSGEKIGGLGDVSRSYLVKGYPTFYVVDPQGRIAWRSNRGMPTDQELMEIARVSSR